MGKRHNTYSRSFGYYQDEADRLKGIALPEKIKCGRCLKNVPQAKYSTKQLTDARAQVKECGQIKKPVICKSCTGQQVVEMECTMCGKTKGTEEFSKAQRSKPDTAKCFKCMEIQVKEEAINEDRYEDPDKAFVTPNHSAGIYPDYFSSATSTTGSSSTSGKNEWDMLNTVHGQDRYLDSTDSESGGIALPSISTMSISDSADYEQSSFENSRYGNADDQQSQGRTGSWHTQSVGASSTTSSYNPHNYNNPPAKSINGSSRSFGSSMTERSNALNGEVNKNAMLHGRSSATSREGMILPSGDAAREREPLVNAWASDEEDEEEGDSDNELDDDFEI